MAIDIRKVELVGQGETRGIRACNVLGDLIHGKVSATDTNGAFSMVEEVVPPGGGTPPHVHSREDEVFYVLEGECEFWTREGTVRAKAGETVHAPRNIPHCFRNVSDHPARMLTLIHRPAWSGCSKTSTLWPLQASHPFPT